MGVRLAAAMGNKVTAISSSPSKKDAALELGAETFVISTDADSMKAAAGSLDLILNTVSADHQVKDAGENEKKNLRLTVAKRRKTWKRAVRWRRGDEMVAE